MMLRSTFNLALVAAIALWSFSAYSSESSVSINLRLLDADTGKPVDGAMALGYWSKDPPTDPLCAATALFGIPVHCSGTSIVIAVVEARSDGEGAISLPDPNRRGWKPGVGQRFQVVIFKDGYFGSAVQGDDVYNERESLCISRFQMLNTASGATPVLIYPQMSRCLLNYSPNSDKRNDSERRWDMAQGFAQSIQRAVRGAEDKQAVVAQLQKSIEAADVVLFPPPSTRKVGPWNVDEVWTHVHQIRQQRSLGDARAP